MYGTSTQFQDSDFFLIMLQVVRYGVHFVNFPLKHRNLNLLFFNHLEGWVASAGNNFSYLAGHVSFQIFNLVGHIADLIRH